MALVMMAILDPGDEVIVFSPIFPSTAQIELAGGVCIGGPHLCRGELAVDEPASGRHYAEDQAIIFNNPCNPTGMGYERKTLELLAGWLRSTICLHRGGRNLHHLSL